jgi:TolA-binding protein
MRKNRRRLQASRIATVLAVCALAACDQRPSPPPSLVKTSPQVSSELLEAFSYVDSRLAQVEQQVRQVQSRIDRLEQDEQSVTISTESGSNIYQLARTKYGTFTISAKDVTPYLDGFKLRLEIGNLTSANFQGAEISVAWGGNHKKQFKVTNSFMPGSFTEVEVALTPATSEGVKHLIVGMSVDRLVLQIH